MSRKVMIEVDDNDFDDFIERGIVRAEVVRNATLMYESDDCVNRQAVLKQLRGCLLGGEVEYQRVKLYIDSIPPVLPKHDPNVKTHYFHNDDYCPKEVR